LERGGEKRLPGEAGLVSWETAKNVGTFVVTSGSTHGEKQKRSVWRSRKRFGTWEEGTNRERLRSSLRRVKQDRLHRSRKKLHSFQKHKTTE